MVFSQRDESKGSAAVRGHELLSEDVLAPIGVLTADEVRGSNAALAREALGSLRGIAVRVESDGGGGPALYLADLVGAAATSRTSAARRRGVEMTRTSPCASPASSRPRGHQRPSCFTALMSGAEGISSGADLEQGNHGSRPCYATSPSLFESSVAPATSARYASQQALATVRTRRM